MIHSLLLYQMSLFIFHLQPLSLCFFFLNNPAPPEISPLPLHDALPISVDQLDQLPADEERAAGRAGVAWATHPAAKGSRCWPGRGAPEPFASFFQGSDCSLSEDRKSTRLNSSHSQISYAVFCLKKKNKY